MLVILNGSLLVIFHVLDYNPATLSLIELDNLPRLHGLKICLKYPLLHSNLILVQVIHYFRYFQVL